MYIYVCVCMCACIPLASFSPDQQEGRNRMKPLVWFTVCVYVGVSTGIVLCAALVNCYMCHL